MVGLVRALQHARAELCLLFATLTTVPEAKIVPTGLIPVAGDMADLPQTSQTVPPGMELGQETGPRPHARKRNVGAMCHQPRDRVQLDHGWNRGKERIRGRRIVGLRDGGNRFRGSHRRIGIWIGGSREWFRNQRLRLAGLLVIHRSTFHLRHMLVAGCFGKLPSSMMSSCFPC